MKETQPASQPAAARPAGVPKEFGNPPQQIGPYRIIEEIGEGGFGVVYLAEQTAPVRRRVALKVLKPGMDSKEIIARFEAERQALALMDHPNIATVLGAGATETGRPYFVMELVKGIRITEYCDKHKLTPRQRLELFIAVCHATQHAHQKGIIHRDIKPSNILVAYSDGQPMAKIIDFGVAKALEQRLTDKTLFTMHGQMIGTPTYMSPEQAEMSVLDIDTRTDIYALGVLLYELLVGTTPFDSKRLRAASNAEVQRIIREEDPHKPSTRVGSAARTVSVVSPADTPVSQFRDDTTSIEYIANHRQTDPTNLTRLLRGELDWIVMKAMEKDRTRRYQTANALALDVQHHLYNEPVSAGPPSAVYRFSKFARRHKGFIGAIGAVAAALVVGLSLALYGFVSASRERDQKEEARALAVAALEQEQLARDESEAVTTFLTDMLRAVDPVRQGRDVAVREVLDQAAGKIAQDFADRPELEARLRETVGVTYHSLGLLDQAEPHLLVALETRRRLVDEEDKYLLEYMGNLGSLYVSQGRYDEAEPLVSSTLEGSSRVLGEQDDRTLETMNDLAVIHQRRGRHQEAEQLFVKALDIRRRTVGPEHARTLAAMNNLAVLYKSLGRYDEAQPLYVKVLDIRRRVLGEEHPDTLDSMNNLGRLYESQGRLDEAEPLLLTALEVRRRVLGEEHPDTLTSMNNLALLYKSARRYDEAEPLFVEAVQVGSRALGEEHPRIVVAMHNLSGLYSQQRRFSEAEPLTVKAYEIRRRTLGESNPRTLISMSALANLYYREGRFAEAEPLHAECVELHKSAMPPGFYGTGISIMRHGQCLIMLERYEQAEPVLLEAQQMLESALGEEHNWTMRAMRTLVQLYDAWEKPEQAASWRARVPEKNKENRRDAQ